MYFKPTKLAEALVLPFWKAQVSVPAPTATELQNRYLTAVFGFVSARTGTGMDAEDITAEVFTAAFTSLSRCPQQKPLETDDPVRAWLFGIARRKIADAYRKRSRRPEVALENTVAESSGNAPESRFLAKEAVQVLESILAGLPEIQREALLLKYREELSLDEIGWVLGKSTGAVGQLLHRARQTIRQRGSAYFGIEDESL